MNNFLNTPIKRVGLVLVVAGLAVTAWGYSQWGPFTGLDDCFQYWSKKPGCRAVRGGTGILVAGLVLSVLFDYTLGPLVRWIRNGNPPRDS